MDGHIYFGSLEHQARAKLEQAGAVRPSFSRILCWPVRHTSCSGAQSTMSSAIEAGIRAGNINISSSGTQGASCVRFLMHTFRQRLQNLLTQQSVAKWRAVRMALSSSSESSISQTEDLQRQVEARRIARTIIVPTLDLQVRQALRDRGEPITLFGERVHCFGRLIDCRKQSDSGH